MSTNFQFIVKFKETFPKWSQTSFPIPLSPSLSLIMTCPQCSDSTPATCPPWDTCPAQGYCHHVYSDTRQTPGVWCDLCPGYSSKPANRNMLKIVSLLWKPKFRYFEVNSTVGNSKLIVKISWIAEHPLKRLKIIISEKNLPFFRISVWMLDSCF